MGKGGCASKSKTPADDAAAAATAADEQQPILKYSNGSGSNRLISPSLLSTKCTPAECWLAHRNVVYDATHWLGKHPGGMRTILSNSGRDATAVLLAMHDPKVLDDSLRRMRKVGVLDVAAAAAAAVDVDVAGVDAAAAEEEKKDDTPAASAAAEEARRARERAAALERDFLELDERLAREGWYEPTKLRYWAAIIRVVVLLVAGVGLTLLSSGQTVAAGPLVVRIASLVLGSTLIGTFFQQIAFFGHDAGHGSITGSFRSDGYLGLLVGNALAGIDIGWWKSTHNVHHVATNSVHDDPDIQHLPIFCFEEEMVHGGEKKEPTSGDDTEGGEHGRGIWSTYHGRFMSVGDLGRYLMRYQHLYFYPVMAFARFNLYVQSIIHLVRTCPFGFGAGWGSGSGSGTTTGAAKASPSTASSTSSSSSTGAVAQAAASGQQPTKREPYEWPTATPAMWTAQVLSLSAFYGLWYMLLSRLDLPSAVVCVGVSHIVAGILHVQILLSHIAMHYHDHTPAAQAEVGNTAAAVVGDGNGSGTAVPVGFHELQALTTMDIACHPALDWFHGGLQFQLEHHLFPRVPKFRLRKLIPLVDAVFARHGVPTVRQGFVEANGMVLRHMARVGKSISHVKGD